MSLPEPVDRTPFHQRSIEFSGFLRADGLWDLEGRLRDTKSFDYLDYRNTPKPAGLPVHDMAVRLTLDDDKVVRDVQVSMMAAPYGICREVEQGVRALIGARIGAGWKDIVRSRLPARTTCTHLAELIVAMATAAYQTQALGKAPQGINPFAKMAESHHKPYFLNKCHSYRVDGPVVREAFPRYARASADGDQDHQS